MKIFLLSSKKSEEKLGISTTIKKHFESPGNKFHQLCFEDQLHSPNPIKAIIKSINQSDGTIIEVTEDSFYLGQVLILAVTNNKPVLVLSKGQNYKAFSDSTKCMVRCYRDEKDIEIILRNFIEFIDANHFTKFNFIIPAEIDNYLEWHSKQKKRPKSEIAREAIQKIMECDSEYRTYLNEI